MRSVTSLALVALGGHLVAVLQEPAAGDRQEPKAPQGEAREAWRATEPLEDEFLDWMAGSWSGNYTMMGMKFEVTARYEWTLGHQFLKAREAHEGPVGLHEWDAYTRGDGGVYATWFFESDGSTSQAKGGREGDALVLAGNDPKQGPFRGTTRRKNADEMAVFYETGPDAEGHYEKQVEWTLRRAKR